MSTYCDDILRHYKQAWNATPSELGLAAGPIKELPPGFRVLEFPPKKKREVWTYATCCMSQPSDEGAIELHLFSPQQSDLHVELLTAICHYHRTEVSLGLAHTVNFGRPWLPESECTFGLISLPYLDGPKLEYLRRGKATQIRFLWLIPITEKEREFKKKHGLEALEDRFEEQQFNYADPERKSVV